ncbi:glycoside hydrolase family 43 protein [Candidatus Enterococcus mangumiae]|uniref:Xylan 1,4-beta-xylosidase n=1 Tax=Candidatus Enterococcus mangumiae TaxID=2230878 RepID=A0ABZ2SU78_9ENTE|nr:glycoside hydrolase family 43 protein [Enterococcus sp. DIV1094]MBO0488891.1 glycoside hydrolase family 43 protein [Enterococcus sp. DIV1094]
MFQSKVVNPIIRGFNPDPNILKVGEHYYVIVSSFEWLPGIRVYESTDLINWEHKTDILTDQVSLKGNPINGSIWAPQISYSDGRFYLVYTDVKSVARPFKDAHNYMMSATNIEGPWENPIYLNSSGFDPSLFHDPRTGKKWLLNERWDFRLATPNKSAGIIIQEYDPKQKQMIGPVHMIFPGTELAKTEAPHLYYINDYYYLLTAEGGTGGGHAVTVCRSRDLLGPYEVDPQNPMLTASGYPTSTLQCAGHASLVQTEFSSWYMVHLCTRPIEGSAILGRETAIQEVYWTEDGWLRIKEGGNQPKEIVVIPTKEKVIQKIIPRFFDDFKGAMNKRWNARRCMPDRTWCDLTSRDGYLRMIAGESPQSTFDQHLLAIRQTAFSFVAQTQLEYQPSHFNQMAGLLLFLNEENYYYCCVTWDEEVGKCLRVLSAVEGHVTISADTYPLTEKETILKVVVEGTSGQFYVKGSQSWEKVGARIDVQTLSGGFTGNFVGIGVHDLALKGGSYADFSYFDYQENEIKER